MQPVLGIGGYFIRSADPAALSTWYRDCLGRFGWVTDPEGNRVELSQPA